MAECSQLEHIERVPKGIMGGNRLHASNITKANEVDHSAINRTDKTEWAFTGTPLQPLPGREMS